MVDPAPIRERFSRLFPHLDERGRRLFAAVEAKASGHGGIAAVSRVTGIAASTIGRGLKDLVAEESLAPGRVRRAGGGRRPLVSGDPSLLFDLLALVEPDERGDPMSPLRWTSKGLRRLARELYQVIIDLIGATTTEAGLKVLCELDTNIYPKGIVVSDAEMQAIHIGSR